MPLSVCKTIVKLSKYHAELCKIIKLPNYQVHREIELTSVGVCIGARVTLDAESKIFITKVADKYAPISKVRLIVPGGQQ